MPGIYIHIPFCRKKCNYCNFFSVASVKGIELVINAIIHELKHRKNYLNGCEVNTIYIGGGTPSLLSINQLAKLFDAVYYSFKIDGNAEITIELNPDDITSAYLDGLKTTLVNRLSIGIQSFFDMYLKYLGRNHTAAQGIESLRLIKEKGFENISADLIYGIPALNHESWQKNLAMMDSFGIQHLSAYALTIEERTILEYNIRKKRAFSASESLYIEQYQMLKDFAANQGYLHYEISNFARRGFISRHNSSYWKGDQYIGVGPSAHSYNGSSRQWNICRIDDYIEAMKNELIFYEKEELSEIQKFNEYILTGIRTMWGCNSDLISEKWGGMVADNFVNAVKKYITTGLINKQENTYILSDEGELLADAITADLFIDINN